MRVCVAGAYGAFGMKHLDAIRNIKGVSVTSVMGPTRAKIDAFAAERGIPHAATDLAECLMREDVDAVILSTPTQVHAEQTIACLKAGKHVLVEIPMADNLADSQEIVRVQRETGKIAMAGQVRRFNPSHQWIHNKIKAGELKIQQMDVQTYFFRRSNINAKGEPRSWTDHLLWHHACHTVDLFQYQTGETCSQAFGLEGPHHPDLGIAMDMSIGMKVPSGAICTLSLSFNNDGPLGTVFRYICDNGTYIARYDDLFDGNDQQIDLTGTTVSNNGIELIDREFFAAIRESRQPNANVADVLASMKTLDRIERSFQG
ncbi:MAG: Gfo/Idh/MocA family oxidoreductase [Rhodobacteraceae bacterium]|nr:Gfo/Idh/MocA family oxidoreductase [Paracoccaceae bacterium]